MLPALKFNLEGFQLRYHPLLGRNPPDGESSGVSGLPTEVGETQKRKGLRLSLAALLSVLSGVPPELDQSCLVRMSLQAELSQPFPKLLKEPLGVGPVLKAHHKIICVTDDNHIAVRHFLAPDFYP